MRKLIVSMFVTLDGVMQAPGGPEEDTSGRFDHGGWVFRYSCEALRHNLDELYAQPFDLLLGRKTYDIWAAYWPHKKDGDHHGLAQKFNACTKYVATRSDRTFDWQPAVPLRGDVAAQVAALKQGQGPMLLLQGSGDLLQTLLTARLIDELRIMTFPLVLGTGKRLFGSGTVPASYNVTNIRTAASGIVLATYVPAAGEAADSADADH